jgi:glycosyltransferase involved in cell wall biosynthesis
MSATRRRRLCMVVHAAYPLDVRVRREARVAVAEGYDVDIFALRRDAEPREAHIDAARVFRMPLSHRRGTGLRGILWEYAGFSLLATIYVAMRALRERYDVVQVHNPPDFLILSALLPRLLGARVIFDIHDLAPDMFAMRFGSRRGAKVVDRVLRVIESTATRVSDAVITVHEPYRRELLARGVAGDKTVVVMNSVDEQLLPVLDSTTQASNEFRVVYHGTITPPYGVELVVEAAAQLIDEIPSLAVEIYGEGDSLPKIRARVHALGIADRVYVSGRYIPQVEVLERVRGARVGVIPNLQSRLNRFALSSKLFEYIVLGIPVVCADLPTIREHFTQSEVLFFRAGDHSSLAAALRAVAADPASAAGRASAARRRYEKCYSWRVNASRYADVLNRLASLSDCA